MAESTRSTVEEDIWDFLDTEDTSEVHSTSKIIEHSALSFLDGTSASEFQGDLEVDLDGQFSVVQQHDDTNQDATSHHMLELENMLLGSIGLGVLPHSWKLLAAPEKAHASQQELTTGPDFPDLSSDLQNRLVEIYFQNFHPLCPVVDEIEFSSWYGSDQLDGHGARELLGAMIFVAFAHVSDEELGLSSFTSIPEAQRACFRTIKYRFDKSSQSRPGDISLVQIALLLSHWSPFDDSKEVSTYWVDQAFHHATIANLSEGLKQYSRVIWWCCVARTRALALGLRRPDKVKSFEAGRMIQSEDFGSIAFLARAGRMERKIFEIEAFIALCKLSDLMNRILILRNRSGKPSDWRAENTWPSMCKDDLNYVVRVDKDLGNWKSLHRGLFEKRALTRSQLLTLQILRIIHLSTLMSLYEPYMKYLIQQRSPAFLLYKASVERVKETSFAIGEAVQSLWEVARVEDLPAWL
ncbi:uncharacterized protein A1O5_02051 [Cladophialophora psammophila CBS 110553]|uniref:Xylanolytic transcriptional activator regulatory domain-containing protein n=1 Tax=Cladophialophora psammophila CBS 110553 TaxID=1182543 RepID=W9XDG9_9EURO|nr:uncharacterized protein A1O5_02051 [Cladophialophora psammophila CBS 110553]EXJ75355.1 hypothetical protein A1O5_02051 [Cladophialophora psammophila CBS 110553]